jgi:hypothetical protein
MNCVPPSMERWRNRKPETGNRKPETAGVGQLWVTVTVCLSIVAAIEEGRGEYIYRHPLKGQRTEIFHFWFFS